MEYVIQLLTFLELPGQYLMPVAGITTLIAFVLFLYLSFQLFRIASLRYVRSKYFHISNPKWYRALKETNFFAALGYFGAGFMARFMAFTFFPAAYQYYHATAAKIVTIYFLLCILILLNKILSVVVIVNKNTADVPLKGIAQFLRIFINFFGVLIIFAFFAGREPTYFISALGIMMSVLLIIFKDTILGFTASWQLAMNNMLHLGDWIESSKHNANGEVTDISLTTVTVQNWDKTIVTVPAYDLIANSFQNWRGMREAGARRIKRSMYIDMHTIRFADKGLIEKFKKIELLKSYITQKEAELARYNSTKNVGDYIGNGRNLTNIGTFRVYCLEYIRSLACIDKNFTSMVRQLNPTTEGLPLEIYCFANTTVWAEYENCQSDIFDHLLAIMEEFDLQVFQRPAGRSLKPHK